MYSLPLFRHEGDVVFFRIGFGIAARRGVDGQFGAVFKGIDADFSYALRKGDAGEPCTTAKCPTNDFTRLGRQRQAGGSWSGF